MLPWLWLAGAAASPVVLYGMHRACLAMEDRGWIYYLRKQPERHGASCFSALQQAVEPQARHVLVVHEEKRDLSDDGAAGPGDPPRIIPTR